MRKLQQCATAIAFTLLPFCLFGQTPGLTDTSAYFNRVLDANPRIYRSHDTVWIRSGICKTLKVTMFAGDEAAAYINKYVPVQARIPFIKVHGNIQYDFTYRSFIDTPFSQKDFAQHSVQATVDFVVRDKYPVRMMILNRKSNSPYFDDITDVNVQFNRGAFLNNLKEKLRREVPAMINKDQLVSELVNMYDQKKAKVENLQNWLNHPARVQEIIEEKERAALSRVNDIPAALPTEEEIKKKGLAIADKKISTIKDSLETRKDSLVARAQNKKDSSAMSVVKTRFEKKQEELKDALAELASIKQKIGDTRKSLRDSLTRYNQQLAQVRDPAALKNFIREHKIDAKELPKGWETLSAVNQVGLGRTWVDYSELTVKNISLTGVNAEFTPSRYYLAFAAGKVNYRFRDFVVKNNDKPKQSLYLARAGIGNKEGNNFIVTWYSGKRNLLNYFGNTTTRGNPERVIGMSAESRLQIDANNYLVLEAAKSSFQTAGSANSQEEKPLRKVWNFKDRSNEAYSIKLYSYWPLTATKITGYYRKMGEHFQSFNLQPVNADQTAYQFKLQQSFWKHKLVIDAGVRKNDLSNPFISQGLTSKTVFKSLQATLRIPKYPFVSLGYYPSSQLTIIDNNLVVENQYNTLSAIAGYSYRVHRVGMSSNAVYLKFYNNGADTGFIYYNASSWTINQYIFLNNLQLQTGLTLTSQKELNVLTVEQSASFRFRQWLTISGAIKYNKVNHADILWGGTAGLGITIKNIGTVQAGYDKSYLPGITRNLLPVDMGKVGFYRTF